MITDDDRRNFKRVPTETTASISAPGSRVNIEVELIDLSASGCSFYAHKGLSAGDELDFAVRGANRNLPPLVRRGHIVRIIENERGKLIAFEFHPEE